jgi:glyoxylase-like metal-dependent hydrolase (beta-lactamase superfamily II)
MVRHWTIRPLCFGEFPAFDKAILTYNRYFGERITAPITGWLLHCGDEAILVDTGPSAPEIARRWHPAIRQDAHQAPGNVLRSLGVAPEWLRLVVLSHLHWDHCYNLECFPNARFLVQAEELRAAVDPIATQRLTYEVGIPGLLPTWLAAFDRLTVLRGDADIAPGVRALLLPGHTPGLQGVLVDTASGRHLIASEGDPLAANVGGAEGEPIPPGIHTDVAACLRSLERMRREADVILPGHDSAVFDHTVYPVK